MFFLLESCASTRSIPPTPERFYSGRSGFALLAEGADFYITAEVQAARPILDGLLMGGMTGAELKDFLDMSDTLTAAVFEESGADRADAGGENGSRIEEPAAGTSAGRHFYAAASGRFPSARGGLFFSASKDWEKKISASGITYWHSDKSRLSVFLGPKNAYLSDGDPFAPAPGAASPAALSAMQEGAVLSGWMENPAQAINRIVAAFGAPIEIPAERLVFAVYPHKGEPQKAASPADEFYTAALRFETRSPAQANALVRIFTLARLGMAAADFGAYPDMETLARAFFAAPPRADGNALVLKTGVMSGRDIALLFNTISVY